MLRPDRKRKRLFQGALALPATGAMGRERCGKDAVASHIFNSQTGNETW